MLEEPLKNEGKCDTCNVLTKYIPCLFFFKTGIRAVFSGHYHRNAGGSYKGLEMVVSSAIGCQLGQDTHGLRVVVVTEEEVVHRYYSLTDLGSHGIEKELLDMLAKQK